MGLFSWLGQTHALPAARDDVCLSAADPAAPRDARPKGPRSAGAASPLPSSQAQEPSARRPRPGCRGWSVALKDLPHAGQALAGLDGWTAGG